MVEGVGGWVDVEWVGRWARCRAERASAPCFLPTFLPALSGLPCCPRLTFPPFFLPAVAYLVPDLLAAYDLLLYQGGCQPGGGGGGGVVPAGVGWDRRARGGAGWCQQGGWPQ